MEALAEGEMTTEALTGAWTYDSNDEHIGEVSQVIVNTSGSVEAVIIDVGGFLGIGEKPVELTMGAARKPDRPAARLRPGPSSKSSFIGG